LQEHDEVSLADPAAQEDSWVALGSHPAHAEHRNPPPKNPALQEHDEVSLADPAAQVVSWAAFRSHTAQGEHRNPSP
jgi:hypothetical protein